MAYELRPGSDGHQTAIFLKQNAEEKIEEYGQVAKTAIEKDFKDIVEEINQRKNPASKTEMENKIQGKTS